MVKPKRELTAYNLFIQVATRRRARAGRRAALTRLAPPPCAPQMKLAQVKEEARYASAPARSARICSAGGRRARLRARIGAPHRVQLAAAFALIVAALVKLAGRLDALTRPLLGHSTRS